LRVAEYAAIPPVIAGLGKSYPTVNVKLSPGRGVSGNPVKEVTVALPVNPEHCFTLERTINAGSQIIF
jgi:hypothetical protein